MAQRKTTKRRSSRRKTPQPSTLLPVPQEPIRVAQIKPNPQPSQWSPVKVIEATTPAQYDHEEQAQASQPEVKKTQSDWGSTLLMHGLCIFIGFILGLVLAKLF